MKYFAHKKAVLFFILIIFFSLQPIGCGTTSSDAEKIAFVSGKIVTENENKSVSNVILGILEPPPLASDSVSSSDSLGHFSFTIETEDQQNLTINFKSEVFQDTTEVLKIKPGKDLEDIIVDLAGRDTSDVSNNSDHTGEEGKGSGEDSKNDDSDDDTPNDDSSDDSNDDSNSDDGSGSNGENGSGDDTGNNNEEDPSSENGDEPSDGADNQGDTENSDDSSDEDSGKDDEDSNTDGSGSEGNSSGDDSSGDSSDNDSGQGDNADDESGDGSGNDENSQGEATDDSSDNDSTNEGAGSQDGNDSGSGGDTGTDNEEDPSSGNGDESSDGDSSDDADNQGDAGNNDNSLDEDSGKDYSIESIADLLKINASELTEGEKLAVPRFYEFTEGGGGTFIWDPHESKSNHNGGTIIDPDHYAVPGSTDWYRAANSGSGCWKRPQSNTIDVWDFGVIGDNNSDNTKAVRKIFSLDIPNVHFPAGIYLIKSIGITKFKKITGQRHQTIIKALDGGHSIFTFESQRSKIGFTVRNITFDMNRTSKRTITVKNPKDVIIDHATFIDSDGEWFLQNIIQDINNGGAYGEANISITNSNFENNNDIGSVNIATYDSHLTYGIQNIHIENNTFYNVGGSVLSIRAIVPDYKRSEIHGSFVGVTVKNNMFENLSGGTERFGPIPLEFWGLSKFKITGNYVDTGSLGIGTLNSKEGIIENNTILNQTIASFEISGNDLTFINNKVTDSHSFISATGDTDGITIKDNMVNGSSGVNMGNADMISFRAEGITHRNWIIEDNIFRNYYGGRSYIMIGWGFDLVKNITIRGNNFISETPDSPIRAIYVQYGQNIKIENNEIIYKANIPANSGEKPFIGATPSDQIRSANMTIKGNIIDFKGSVGSSSYLVGIGSQGWVKGTLPNWVIEENTIKGKFLNKYSYAFKINETGSNARVFNNNVDEVEGNFYELHPSVNSDVMENN